MDSIWFLLMISGTLSFELVQKYMCDVYQDNLWVLSRSLSTMQIFPAVVSPSLAREAPNVERNINLIVLIFNIWFDALQNPSQQDLLQRFSSHQNYPVQVI